MLLFEYHTEYAILFGSYARGKETNESDIDGLLGVYFKAKDIFVFGEELRQLTQKDVDAFEIDKAIIVNSDAKPIFNSDRGFQVA